MSEKDNVNHPSHYTWMKGMEVIDITENFNFNRGNALKYLMRAGRKEEMGMTKEEKELEDLEKAQFYLNREILRFKEENKSKLINRYGKKE